MKINQIPSNLTSSSKRKRRGRGSGSGLGKTAGRGVNGQKSRSGPKYTISKMCMF